MNWLLLLAAFFTHRVACEEDFIELRPFDVWSDVSACRNFSRNRRYKDGENIEICLSRMSKRQNCMFGEKAT